jgi:hypothetical protein
MFSGDGGGEQAVEKRPSAAFPSSFAVQRTRKYASRLRISGALHLGIPYPVRDKLLNSLQKRLFQHAVRRMLRPMPGKNRMLWLEV